MTSVFPFLLSYLLFAPTFLRIVVGLYFFSFGYQALFGEYDRKISFFRNSGLWPAPLFLYSIALVEIICAVLIFSGALTQVAAGILAVIAATAGIIKMKNPDADLREVDIYTLLTAILFSLMITGPGYIAVDLPL